MVFFTCNHCGDSVKKPAVEKHYYQKCRGKPVSVSCMDCLKDFYGEEYVAHIKCISEEAKYSGKGYIEKASKNKGAKKQEDWMETIRSILETSNYNLSPYARSAFEKLQNVDNVPRKKNKFQNFVSNCLHMSPRQSEEIWKVLEKELGKCKVAKQKDSFVSNVELEKNSNVKSQENGEEPKTGEEPGEKTKKSGKRQGGNSSDIGIPISKKKKTRSLSDETKETKSILEESEEINEVTEKKSKNKKTKKQAKDKVAAESGTKPATHLKIEQELDVTDKLETDASVKPVEKGKKAKNADSKKFTSENVAESVPKKRILKATSDIMQLEDSAEKREATGKKSRNKNSKKQSQQAEISSESATNLKVEQELTVTDKLGRIGDAEKPVEKGKKVSKKDLKKSTLANLAESPLPLIPSKNGENSLQEENKTKKQSKKQVANAETNNEPKSGKQSKDKKSRTELQHNMLLDEASSPTNLTNTAKKSKKEAPKNGIASENSDAKKFAANGEKKLSNGVKKTKGEELKKAAKRQLAVSKDSDEGKKAKYSKIIAASVASDGEKDVFSWTRILKEIVDKHKEGISVETLEKFVLKKRLSYLGLEKFNQEKSKKFEKKFVQYLNKCSELQVNGNIVKCC